MKLEKNQKDAANCKMRRATKASEDAAKVAATNDESQTGIKRFFAI